MSRKHYTLVNRIGTPEIILQVRFALSSRELAVCWYNSAVALLGESSDIVQQARIAGKLDILKRIKEVLKEGGEFTTSVALRDREEVDMIAAIFEDRFGFRDVEFPRKP